MCDCDEKELKKRITSSALVPITTSLGLADVIQCWESVSTEDDKQVVEKLTNEIKSHLYAANAAQDFASICASVSSTRGHGIDYDNVEVALAKLVAKGEVERNGNCYHMI